MKKDEKTFAMTVARAAVFFKQAAAIVSEKKFDPIHESIIDWLVFAKHAWQCDPYEGHLRLDFARWTIVTTQLQDSSKKSISLHGDIGLV